MTNVTWNGITYSIPAAGEKGWPSLSDFLIALGNNAAIAQEVVQALNVQSGASYAVSATTDYSVLLTNAAARAVTLPAGVANQIFLLVDGSDASTGNITITPNGAELIAGAATLVLNKNKSWVMIQYHAGSTDWKVIAQGQGLGNLVSLSSGVTGTLPIGNGGTGQTTANTAINALLPAQTANRLLKSDGTNTSFDQASLTTDVSGTLPLANGGTNNTAIASGLVRSNGTTLSGAGTVALATEVTGTLAVPLGGTGVGTLAVDGVLIGNGASAVAVSVAGLADQVFRVPGSGLTPAFGAVDLTKAAAVTGALGIGNGGTGQTTANTALNALLPAQTNNRLLKSDGTNTSFAQASLSTDVTGTLPIANGGTGQTAANAAFGALSPMTTNGDIITRAAGVPSRIGVGTDGQVLGLVSGAPAWTDGGGGAGEKNYVTNPSAKSAITGWTSFGTVDVARTTTAAELPREFTTAAGIKITAATGTQDPDNYVYYDFTLDDVDLSKKLKIQWAQKVTGTYNAGELAVVITTQADRSTALHTPITTAIPSADGVFTTSFDASTTATLSLVIRATTDMTTNGGIVISDVVVGPGVGVQGAVVSEWQSWTPAVNTGTKGTNTEKAYWRRVGSNMEIIYDYVQTVAGSNGSGIYDFSLPTGYTIDSDKLGITQLFGNFYARDNAGNEYAGGMTKGVSSSAAFSILVSTTATSTNYARSSFLNFGSNAALEFRGSGSLPIAEWAGSGTVNLAQADSQEIVIAYNSATDSGLALAAYNIVDFDTEVVDSASRFASDTFTAINPGYYQIDTAVHLVAGTSIASASLDIWKNGAFAYRLQGFPALGVGAGGDLYMSGSATLKLAANDAITIRVYATGVGTYSIAGGEGQTQVSIKRVSVDGQVIGFGAATATSMGLVSAEESGTFTASFTGITAATMDVTVSYARVGKIVTLFFPTATAAANAASTPSTTATGAIPAHLRPATGKSSGYQTKVWPVSNSVDLTTDGYCLAAANGNLTISRDLANTAFANTGVNGWNTFSMTYLIS